MAFTVAGMTPDATANTAPSESPGQAIGDVGIVDGHEPLRLKLAYQREQLLLRHLLLEECGEGVHQRLHLARPCRAPGFQMLNDDANFSADDFAFETLSNGISVTSLQRAAKIFLLFRCWIKGSKPVSFEMIWK